MIKKLPLILFFITLAFSGFSQYDSIPPVQKTKTQPPFTLLSIDSVAFTQEVLDTGKNTILMLFNPECEHCRKQLDRFLQMPEFYGPVQLVMISIETLDKTKLFYQRHHLANYPFIHLGKDFKRFFISYFRAETIPVLAFYDRNKHLRLFKQGDVTEAEILNALK